MGIRISAKEYRELLRDQRNKGVITFPGDNKTEAPVPKKNDYRYVSKKGWVTIGDQRIYYRSLWECSYAAYLQWMMENGEIKSWKHEPRTFWFTSIKRGVRSYLPDFEVVTKKNQTMYIEIKGYMDAKSKTKINRFRKYYPEFDLEIIDKTWFKENKHLAKIVPGWGG